MVLAFFGSLTRASRALGTFVLATIGLAFLCTGFVRARRTERERRSTRRSFLFRTGKTTKNRDEEKEKEVVALIVSVIYQNWERSPRREKSLEWPLCSLGWFHTRNTDTAGAHFVEAPGKLTSLLLRATPYELHDHLCYV